MSADLGSDLRNRLGDTIAAYRWGFLDLTACVDEVETIFADAVEAEIQRAAERNELLDELAIDTRRAAP